MKNKNKQRLSLQSSKNNPYIVKLQAQMNHNHFDHLSKTVLKNSQIDNNYVFPTTKGTKNIYYKKMNKIANMRKNDGQAHMNNNQKQMIKQQPQKVSITNPSLFPNNGALGFPQVPRRNLKKLNVPLIQTNHFGQSQKILKSNQKNSHILNEIIEILKTEPNSHTEDLGKRLSSKCRDNSRPKTLQQANQFQMGDFRQQNLNRRGPKIRNNQFMKLFSKNNINKPGRRIYSEERSRWNYRDKQQNLTQLKRQQTFNIPSSKKNISKQLFQTQVEMLTFYNPSKDKTNIIQQYVLPEKTNIN